jgi:hypothetical protein
MEEIEALELYMGGNGFESLLRSWIILLRCLWLCLVSTFYTRTIFRNMSQPIPCDFLPTYNYDHPHTRGV